MKAPLDLELIFPMEDAASAAFMAIKAVCLAKGGIINASEKLRVDAKVQAILNPAALVAGNLTGATLLPADPLERGRTPVPPPHSAWRLRLATLSSERRRRAGGSAFFHGGSSNAEAAPSRGPGKPSELPRFKSSSIAGRF